MSSAASEQEKVVYAAGHSYAWQGDLNEWTAVQVDGEKFVPFHSLVSQSNGLLLEAFGEQGFL